MSSAEATATLTPRPIESKAEKHDVVAGHINPSFKPTKVWFVLPAYNEQEALPHLFDAIGQAMADFALPYEVVIVDDGSRDETANIIRKRALSMPVLFYQHTVNQGLGATIRDGLKLAAENCADNDVIITMDADNTHPPGLVMRMVRQIQEGYDVIIASRFREGARVVGVPFIRHFLSTVHARCSWSLSQLAVCVITRLVSAVIVERR